MARPKRVFSDEEIQLIGEYALNNCHLDTIALVLEIPKTTLDRRFGSFIKQKRAEGRVALRGYQVALSKVSSDMAKFLGKNILGQVDKQEIKTITEVYKPTPAEEEAAQAAAKVYKLKLAE